MTVSRVVAAASAVGLLLAACSDGGEGDEPSASASPSPSSTVSVPEDVSVTDGGEKLGFGDSANVVFEPNLRRGSVLELTVDKVRQGSIKDFSGFILDPATRASTPYYVKVSVENLGEGDVGGFAVPLYGVNEENILLQASAFTTDFKACESKALPRPFTNGDTFDSCLVFLAPRRGTLEAVSFRPTQEFDPILWTGDIGKPKSDKPKEPQKPKDSEKPQKPKNG